MKDLRIELFNYKKTLTYDQHEIATIVEGHLNGVGEYSEKQIVMSLNERLNSFKYDKSVRNLLENLNTDMNENQLVYDLKNLYFMINKKNQGMLYRSALETVMEAINCDTVEERMSKILNEMAMFDWIPEVKMFVTNITSSPEQRSNLLSAGKSESVYTIVEAVENGYVAFVKNAWFLLSEDKIEKTLLENNIKDMDKLKTLRTLEKALSISTVTEDRINFRLSENLTVGISVVKEGLIFINDTELNGDTTLESLFNSPIIPIIQKNYYPFLLETIKNINKFMELDVVKKITNLIKPSLECYVFNYKNEIYQYRLDEHHGYNFYSYESAIEIVNEIRNDMNYDLTFFFENKLNKEVIVKRRLEDKERELKMTLEDLKININKIEASLQIIGESSILTTAHANLMKRRKAVEVEIEVVKEAQYNERTKS